MTFTGNDVSLDTSDGGFIFALTDATDGTVDIRANNDSDDYISFTTAANVPTIVTAGTSNLAIAPDGGTTAITGILTVSGATTSTGILTATAGVTLANAETITNATNGTITLGGADAPIVDILAAGTSNEDAILSLSADAAADNGDVWRINSDGATNALLFENNTSGSQATILGLAKTGVVTLNNGEYITNAVDNTVTVGSSAAAMVMSVYSSNATNGTAALNLVGDAQADATDSFQIINSANGTLTIGNDDTTPGTYVAKATIDSTGAFTVQGSEATAGSLGIWSDNGDDVADKFTLSMDAADLMTITTGVTTAATVSTAGLWTLPAGVTSSLVTDASSLTAGSIVTAGGIACAKQLYVGDDIDMSVSGTGTYDLTLKTNMADALSITDGTDIMVFATTTGTPTVTITPATTITGATTLTAALTANGDVIGDGSDQLYGFRQEQVASTTAGIAVTGSGKTYVSNSADVMTLPEASTALGMRITFIGGTADDFDINPADGTDVIGPITASGGTITPSAGDAIRITDIGSSVTLEAIGNDLWACVAHNGAITDVN
jgi:hypothetical protein